MSSSHLRTLSGRPLVRPPPLFSATPAPSTADTKSQASTIPLTPLLTDRTPTLVRSEAMANLDAITNLPRTTALSTTASSRPIGENLAQTTLPSGSASSGSLGVASRRDAMEALSNQPLQETANIRPSANQAMSLGGGSLTRRSVAADERVRTRSVASPPRTPQNLVENAAGMASSPSGVLGVPQPSSAASNASYESLHISDRTMAPTAESPNDYGLWVDGRIAAALDQYSERMRSFIQQMLEPQNAPPVDLNTFSLIDQIVSANLLGVEDTSSALPALAHLSAPPVLTSRALDDKIARTLEMPQNMPPSTDATTAVASQARGTPSASRAVSSGPSSRMSISTSSPTPSSSATASRSPAIRPTASSSTLSFNPSGVLSTQPTASTFQTTSP